MQAILQILTIVLSGAAVASVVLALQYQAELKRRNMI